MESSTQFLNNILTTDNDISWTMITDDNASCECLSAPPEFTLPPPPVFFGHAMTDRDLATVFANDPVIRTCPFKEFIHFASTDHLTPPAWVNDGEINIKVDHENIGHYSVSTILAAVGSAVILLILFSAFLVALYCRRNRSNSANIFACFQSKKSNPMERHHSARYVATSSSIQTGRRHSDQRFLHLRWNDPAPMAADDIVDRPVGADWTFRNMKRAGIHHEEFNGIQRPLPTPPRIIITLPDTTTNRLEPQYPLPPAHRGMQPFSSYENHNPIYEEISLRSDSINAGIDQGWSSPQCGYANTASISKIRDKCDHACSGCSCESGYGTEIVRNPEYATVCDVCPSRIQQHERSTSKAPTLNNNGELLIRMKDNERSVMNTKISPNHRKHCYINGSLAASMTDGFDIHLKNSAYV